MVDIQAQVEALVSGALVRPLPELGTLVVTGEERHSWLGGMLTSKIADLETGHGAYTLAVSKNGRIRSEVWLALTEQRALLGIPHDLVDTLREHMDGYLIMEDVDIAASDKPQAWWLAHGPQAAAVAAAARDAGATTVMASYGEFDTAIIIAERDANPTFTDELLATAGAVLATPGGWDRIRIEHMLPRFGTDFGVDNYPQEASLEGLAVSFDKGCYLGQEAVFMLQKRGHVSKRLVRLELDSGAELSPGDEILGDDNAVVGKVTSTSAADSRTFAMGMVRYKQTLSGTKLSVAGHEATVSCLSARDDCG
jgi:folate-binding protein YgfZ